MRKLCVTFLVLMIALTGTACTGSAGQEVRVQDFYMDTIISIQAYGDDREELRAAVDEAMQEFARIQALTDRYPEPGTEAYRRSEICRINENAGVQPVPAGEDVLEMVRLSLEYGDRSGGAFNIAVGGLMDLWGFGKDGVPQVPAAAEIQDCLQRISLADVLLDEAAGTVYLAKTGMILDLGAVAKGYAAEKAAAKLREAGVEEALINAGGNIVTVGLKDGTDKWRIGIEDPRHGGEYLGVLLLEDESAVTSGDYQRNFTEGGVLYHHILDPGTGMPARGTVSVTVVSTDSCLADILSTTLFVLGPEKGLEFLEQVDGAEAVFVGPDGSIRVSPGLEGRVREIKPRISL